MGEVGLFKIRVFQHGDEHGGHPVEGGDLLLVDAVQAFRGENAVMGHMVVPWVMAAVMASTIPKQWNMGTWIISLSAVERSMQSPMALPLFTTL